MSNSRNCHRNDSDSASTDCRSNRLPSRAVNNDLSLLGLVGPLPGSPSLMSSPARREASSLQSATSSTTTREDRLRFLSNVLSMALAISDAVPLDDQASGQGARNNDSGNDTPTGDEPQ